MFRISVSKIFSNNPSFVESTLTRAGVSSKIDDSGQTIGKRYARTDECGIPFAITVDFDTLDDDAVTVRERDSMEQERIPLAALEGWLGERLPAC